MSNWLAWGRELFDGAYQAEVYDCAVSYVYQGKGVGKLFITNILSKIWCQENENRNG